MSDPVTNAEIEDVLTSIRRLVSENRKAVSSVAPDTGPSAGKALKNTGPGVGVSEPTALVLTPALRVPEDETPDAQAREAEDLGGDRDENDGETVFAASFEDDEGRDALTWEESLEEAQEEAGAPDPFEELTGDDDWADALDIAEPQDAFADAELVDEPVQRDGFAEDEDGDDAAITAVVEGADAPAFEDANADPEQDMADGPDGTPCAGEAEGDDGLPERFHGDAGDGDEEAPFDFQQVLEARISQWRDGEPQAGVEEPDSPGDSDYAGTDMMEPAWDSEPAEPVDDSALDALEAELEEEFVEDVEAAVMPDLAGIVDEAMVIDEESLREMVADIVRQELQGALGERITRNVRKLVRREIHRALAAHDLD